MGILTHEEVLRNLIRPLLAYFHRYFSKRCLNSSFSEIIEDNFYLKVRKQIMEKKIKRKKWSPTSIMHLYKMVIRSVFFLTALGLYIYDKVVGNFQLFSNQTFSTIFLVIILGIYLVEMILRFFPNKIESMGCQKIFKKN